MPRRYKVLEELDVADVVQRLVSGVVDDAALDAVVEALGGVSGTTVYSLLSEQEARNALQARRQAARVFKPTDDLVPDRLISVPEKNWQSGPLNRDSRLTVG